MFIVIRIVNVTEAIMFSRTKTRRQLFNAVSFKTDCYWIFIRICFIFNTSSSIDSASSSTSRLYTNVKHQLWTMERHATWEKSEKENLDSKEAKTTPGISTKISDAIN